MLFHTKLAPTELLLDSGAAAKIVAVFSIFIDHVPNLAMNTG